MLSVGIIKLGPQHYNLNLVSFFIEFLCISFGLGVFGLLFKGRLVLKLFYLKSVVFMRFALGFMTGSFHLGYWTRKT